MKQVLVCLLAVLYLAAGMGFTMREHYCMGNRIGAVIEHPARHSDSHRCDRCGMVKKTSNGCCKDKIKTFKSSPDQTLAKALSFEAVPLVADIPVTLFTYQGPSAFAAVAQPAAPAHGPPLSSGIPLYLRVRSLRI